jgi:glycosyltransferase involved in cell wall biosynthesis
MTPLFSVIIPAYNSDEYLLETLNSVLKQKFLKKKYEIIIINDCSTDKTGSIVKIFRKKFENIRVINNQKNQGVAFCRNIGIKNAKGTYLIFLDSDDELKNNSLLKIEKILSKQYYDLILCLEFKSNKLRINPKAIRQLDTVDSFIAYENKERIYNPYCWNMILNRSFLQKKKITFKKINIYEDQVFCTEVLFSVKRIKIIPGTFYKYIMRPLSLSRQTNYSALVSCLHALMNFFQIIKNLKLTNEKNIFIQNRINFIINIINKYAAICNLSQIKKISSIYKKFTKKIDIKNSPFYNNFFSISNLGNLRKKIIFKIKNYKFQDFDKIYIFGFGLSGRTIFHVLKNQKVKVDSFVDSEKKFLDTKYFGIKIISPQSLRLKINQADLKSLVIISVTEKKVLKFIIKKLKDFGFKNRNIKILDI